MKSYNEIMKFINDLTEAALITTPSNLFYLTSYKNSDAKLLYYNNRAHYFTDARYFEEIKENKLNAKIIDIKEFDTFIGDNKITNLYIEDGLEYSEFKHLKKELKVKKFISITDKINKMRAIKSKEEIDKIKAAQEITDKTFYDVLGNIKEGMTEKELSAILSATLYKNGAESLAFDNIVAFGKNTSKPHAHPTDNKLMKGMPVLLDFGAKLNSYCSDMTRTVFFGKPDDEMINTYNIVLEAQKIALNNIRIGMTGIACDSLSRSHFMKLGLVKNFLHSLGHSLGIDIHEMPKFSMNCADIMERNMVLTVEPGLYFEDRYGIRIEDIIYFDKNTVINLTKSEKNLIIV